MTSGFSTVRLMPDEFSRERNVSGNLVHLEAPRNRKEVRSHVRTNGDLPAILVRIKLDAATLLNPSDALFGFEDIRNDVEVGHSCAD
jgi:hypothetical protein